MIREHVSRPVHTRQQIVARNGNIVAAPVKVAVSANNLLPFSATLLPGVDRPWDVFTNHEELYCLIFNLLHLTLIGNISFTNSQRSTIVNCHIYNAQNPLHTFPRNFSVDGEVANLLATSRFNGIWETTRHSRHNASTCYRLVAHLLRGSRQLVTVLLRGNWCNGFWP